MNTSTPSTLAVNYLQNLIKLKPDNIDLKIALAQQELSLGNIEEASEIINPFLVPLPYTANQWKALWIYYQILRTKAYALPEKSPQRRKYLDDLRTILPVLAQSKYLSDADLDRLAQDSVGFGQVGMAVTLYKMNAGLNLNKPVSYFANAAKVALYDSDYASNAMFNSIAMRKSKSLADKRRYFMAAVTGLMAGNLYDQAMRFAQTNIDGLANDKQTLLFLSNMSLRAGKPGNAEKYVKQLLHLKYN